MSKTRAEHSSYALTPEAIQATRQWFADNAMRCIEEAQRGDFHVNDLESYVENCRKCAASSLAGESDNTFAFRQRAHWIQTGDCVPLFSK